MKFSNFSSFFFFKNKSTLSNIQLSGTLESFLYVLLKNSSIFFLLRNMALDFFCQILHIVVLPHLVGPYKKRIDYSN